MTNAIINAIRSAVYAIGSACATFATFCEHSLPVVQWICAVVAICAGVASFQASRATHRAIKETK